MNWKPQIFKPRWQHKDPEIRRQAVATEQEPELAAALGTICLEDEDPGVRSAAARRLTEPAVLQEAVNKEIDASVRRTLEDRLRQLTASSAADRCPLATRLQVVEDSEDRELLEAAAANAPEAELREAALRKCPRQGFLGDRAINDPEPSLRRLAASFITQQSTLRRVIDGTRTTDKGLHHALEERLHQELLAAGDTGAINREAQAICEAVEQAALATTDPDENAVRTFRERWTQIDGKADAALAQRFERDLKRLAAGNAPPVREPEPESAPAAEPQPVPDTPEPAPAAEAPATAAAPSAEGDHDALQLALEAIRELKSLPLRKLPANRLKEAENRWQHTWSKLANPDAAAVSLQREAEDILQKLRERLAEAESRIEQRLQNVRQLLDQLGTELEDGELHKALETRLNLQKIGKKLGRHPRWQALSSEIGDMQAKLRELRGWHHWSNNRIRKQMIREMEALPASGLHPDAVLGRIKELQTQWKGLEQSEQIPGDTHFAAAPWMWRKFNAAGKAAFESTKPFLDKRTEVQQKHLEETRALAAELAEAAGQEAPDWKHLATLMRKAREALRSLDEVPARLRQKTARLLKKSLDAGHAAQQGHYDEVERQKQRLIREAAQLAHATDQAEAIARAKSLQADWKAAGSLWRSRENQLWREFREHLDPLFAELKAEQDSEREARKALVNDQKSLCAEIRSILDMEDDALAGQHGKVLGLEDSWREIARPDRRLQQDFQRLLDTYNQRLAASERKAERLARENWWKKADLLHEAEAACQGGGLSAELRASLEERWPQDETHEEIEQHLDDRFAAVLAAESAELTENSNDVAIEAARKLCICLEFLAGIESPSAEKDLRMQYQVDRLSKSMSGERQRMSAVDEARMLESRWLSLAFVPDAEFTEFRSRVRTAVQSITESI